MASLTSKPYPTVKVHFPADMRALPANESDDPLTRALAPPPNETPEERTERVKLEIAAQRVSDQIDEAIKQEKTALKKKRAVKMLLLGQSESGKSTTLKNMQLAYAPRMFAAERASWRAVIQLNLVRSVNAILDALSSELTSPDASGSPTPYLFPSSLAKPPSSVPDSSAGHIDIPPDRRSVLMKLKLRLAPLRQVEADLKARLGTGTDEITETMLSQDPEERGSIDSETLMAASSDDVPYIPSRRLNPNELVVRSHVEWKEKEKARSKFSLPSIKSSGTRPGSSNGGHSVGEGDRDTATDVLAGCAEDMMTLWRDPLVREVVKRRRVIRRLWDSAEYFLNRISTIAAREYEPSNDDVLRARIRTLGVQEYIIPFESGNDRNGWHEWRVYDVGGSRTARAAWLPYFTDAHAVLFLAPISAFDEFLAEDKRVNRLEDSFLLWQAICKSELLKRSIIILFMNKCDILTRKLEAGIKVNKYMTSYGARANEPSVFAHYLQNKFKDLLLTLSPAKRPFYVFQTSVVDTVATANTLSAVRDGILQTHLRSANFVV
ncbi:guanine nucleotide binding protein, alpha subunit [Cytidiella melzeri]|nr:guanine nucleotide binding protein, alpha subunit [Cytidiella melzeri]